MDFEYMPELARRFGYPFALASIVENLLRAPGDSCSGAESSFFGVLNRFGVTNRAGSDFLNRLTNRSPDATVTSGPCGACPRRLRVRPPTATAPCMMFSISLSSFPESSNSPAGAEPSIGSGLRAPSIDAALYTSFGAS